MKRILLFILIIFSISAPDFLWAAGNQTNRTLTINNGMGVNNGTNRTTVTPNDNDETACARGNQGSCEGGPFADTSDPFNLNHDCQTSSDDFCSSSFDPGLPGGFTVVDNRFGRGAPCGPNDTTGPPFPYPCHTKGSINQKIPFGMDDTSNGNSITLGPPSLGAVGQPYYQFRSDSFGTLRVHHIEYGFDLDLPDAQNLKMFFNIDSVTDANGQMVGNATGTFRMTLNDNGMGSSGSNCNVTANSVSSSGQFESGMTGVITCVDRAGNLCMGSAFTPATFSRTSFFCPP
jgi:hypothetical protein